MTDIEIQQASADPCVKSQMISFVNESSTPLTNGDLTGFRAKCSQEQILIKQRQLVEKNGL